MMDRATDKWSDAGSMEACGGLKTQSAIERNEPLHFGIIGCLVELGVSILQGPVIDAR